MPLQAWGSFFWEVWGLVLPCNPPLNPGRFDGPLGHALSPMAMEDVDAHVGPPSCLGCEAAAFSVAPASRTWGWASAPSPAALLFTSVSKHKEARSAGKPAAGVEILLRPASHRHWPCPRRGPQPRPSEQLEVARRAGSGLLGPLPKCPTGLQGRVTWRLRRARLAPPQ